MGEALGAGQPHGHVALLAAMADLGGDALGLQRGGAGVGGQLASGVAERHAARLTLEQRDAQLVLQLGDLPADRRGRHVLRAGGGGDRALRATSRKYLRPNEITADSQALPKWHV